MKKRLGNGIHIRHAQDIYAQRPMIERWRKCKNEDARFAVMAKFTDQLSLATIALCEPADGLRAEAVKRLRDKMLLRRIARTDANAFVRTIAQMNFEHPGPEPWLTLDWDDETAKLILDFIYDHLA